MTDDKDEEIAKLKAELAKFRKETRCANELLSTEGHQDDSDSDYFDYTMAHFSVGPRDAQHKCMVCRHISRYNKIKGVRIKMPAEQGVIAIQTYDSDSATILCSFHLKEALSLFFKKPHPSKDI